MTLDPTARVPQGAPVPVAEGLAGAPGTPPPDDPPPAMTGERLTTGAATGTARAAMSFLSTPVAATGPEDPPAAAEISMDELKKLGRTDKAAFFRVLLPGAIASEKKYGVPASVILAQAALESGWGKHAIGGFNLFGIKGQGPAGGRTVNTREQTKSGAWVTVKHTFAQFHSVAEAIEEHGQVYLRTCYGKARQQFTRDHDPYAFVRAIAPSYASAKNYASLVISIMNNYGIMGLVKGQGGH